MDSERVKTVGRSPYKHRIIKCKIIQFMTNLDTTQLTADRPRRQLKQREHVVKAPRSEQKNLVLKQSRKKREDYLTLTVVLGSV